MPVDRESLASVVYWRGNRQPQRFYVALCLLMSSIQDAFLGLKERASANLNWSATCSYYSLVHVGRLLTFIALGDYPTQHRELRQLFAGSRPQGARPPSSRDGYPFDWLRGFTAETAPGQREPGAPTPRAGVSELRDAMADYFTNIGVQGVAGGLEQFAAVLKAAAELRNDSNYEALLIAHEYDHVVMSAEFESLAVCMCEATERSRPFVIEVFTCFLENDLDLEAERAGYCAFANAYLTGRLIPAIDRKVGDSRDLKKNLRDIVGRLARQPADGDYRRLEDAASLEIFGGKTRLMTGFRRKIEELRRATGGEVI
jgi:hypothetical protein